MLRRPLAIAAPVQGGVGAIHVVDGLQPGQVEGTGVSLLAMQCLDGKGGEHGSVQVALLAAQFPPGDGAITVLIQGQHQLQVAQGDIPAPLYQGVAGIAVDHQIAVTGFVGERLPGQQEQEKQTQGFHSLTPLPG